MLSPSELQLMALSTADSACLQSVAIAWTQHHRCMLSSRDAPPTAWLLFVCFVLAQWLCALAIIVAHCPNVDDYTGQLNHKQQQAAGWRISRALSVTPLSDVSCNI